MSNLLARRSVFLTRLSAMAGTLHAPLLDAALTGHGTVWPFRDDTGDRPRASRATYPRRMFGVIAERKRSDPYIASCDGNGGAAARHIPATPVVGRASFPTVSASVETVVSGTDRTMCCVSINQARAFAHAVPGTTGNVEVMSAM